MRRIGTTLIATALLSSVGLWTGAAFAWNPKEPVNGYSKDSLFRSIQAITRGMSDEEKITFRRGFNSLMVAKFPLTFGMNEAEARAFMPMVLESAHITMDGARVGEIMTRGKEISMRLANTQPAPPPKSALLERVVEQNELQEERERNEEEMISAGRKCLTEKLPLTINYVRKNGVFDDIELTVTNNLSWPVSYLGFDYELTTEGRKAPFSTKEVARTMRDGLKPAETRMVRITASAVPKDLSLDALQINFNLLNVGDMEGRSLLSKPKSLFLGGLSDKKCE